MYGTFIDAFAELKGADPLKKPEPGGEPEPGRKPEPTAVLKRSKGLEVMAKGLVGRAEGLTAPEVIVEDPYILDGDEEPEMITGWEPAGALEVWEDPEETNELPALEAGFDNGLRVHEGDVAADVDWKGDETNWT